MAGDVNQSNWPIVLGVGLDPNLTPFSQDRDYHGLVCGLNRAVMGLTRTTRVRTRTEELYN